MTARGIGHEPDGLPDSTPANRPQALLLTFFGAHVLGRAQAVAAGSLVEVLERIGVGEPATRSTLARMSRRGLLVTHRRGRRAFLTLSDRATTVLHEASTRVWDEGAVNRDWDGEWTLFGFSLPESRRSERHLLRSRLVWAGFGMLQHGLWMASYPVDPRELLSDLDVVDHVVAFRATALPFIDVDDMIARAWDLDTLGGRYEAFLSRWDRRHPLPDAPDDLARQLLLLSEWLLLVREDPRLPARHLPTQWPAARAQSVALRLRERYAGPASSVVARTVEHIELDAAETADHAPGGQCRA